MKVKKCAECPDLKNEHAGFVFQKGNNVQLVTTSKKNDRVRNANQLKSMSLLSRCVREFRNQAIEVLQSWQAFVTAFPQPAKKPDSGFLSVYQNFVKRNFYCLQNSGVLSDFMTNPELIEKTNPEPAMTVVFGNNVIDVSELYVKFFGRFPVVGQYVKAVLIGMSETSGQFFEPVEQMLKVENVYIDGLFIDLSFTAQVPGVVYSLFLSRPVNQSQAHTQTKCRYMGCFTTKSFLGLTDAPESFDGQAGKVLAVNDDENGLVFVEGGGGGLTCDDLVNCPTFANLVSTVNEIAVLVSGLADVSIPAIHLGLLYNYAVSTDSRYVANSGWHIPKDAEILALQNYLGGYSVAGGKLKETGLSYWESPNAGATNEVYFNGKGAGYRDVNGQFVAMKSVSYFHEVDSGYGTYYRLQAVSTALDRVSFGSVVNHRLGCSIRLVKDVTTLSNGQSGTYVGNNGRIYRTICINGKEWTADNLAETLFRNGDTINEVTDSAVWKSSYDPALCAYNNDWSNV